VAVADGFERQLIAPAHVDVRAAAPRADRYRVGDLAGRSAAVAGDGGGHRDDLDGRAVRLRARGDHLERLRHRGGIHRVPYPAADTDAGHLPPGRPFLDGIEDAFAQPELVHGVTSP
jgi:hypothetical protein